MASTGWRRERSPRVAALVAALLLAAAGAGALGTTQYLRAQEAEAEGAAAAARAVQAAERARRERAEARAALKEDLAASLDQLESFSRAFRAVARLVSPSVVNIRATGEIAAAELDSFHPSFPLPFGDDGGEARGARRIPQTGEGSGVVYSADGYILTNHHVVRGADRIEVRTAEGRELPARVVGLDPKTDLAVLRVDAVAAGDLLPAELGRSSEVAVGDWVVAIGSPFGLKQTVTAGIVSGIGRAGVGISDYEDFIQTDAAINPGNSGGPLVDLRGRVIAINTAIASRTGGFQGVGFAIPIDMARAVADQLIAGGRVRRGWLGVSIQAIDSDRARRLGLPDTRGALVGGVLDDGPAAGAGLRAGDVILAVDGEAVDSPNALRNRIAARRPESEVEIAIHRDGGRKEIVVRLGELPDDVAARARPERQPPPRQGEGSSGPDRD